MSTIIPVFGDIVDQLQLYSDWLDVVEWTMMMANRSWSYQLHYCIVSLYTLHHAYIDDERIVDQDIQDMFDNQPLNIHRIDHNQYEHEMLVHHVEVDFLIHVNIVVQCKIVFWRLDRQIVVNLDNMYNYHMHAIDIQDINHIAEKQYYTSKWPHTCDRFDDTSGPLWSTMVPLSIIGDEVIVILLLLIIMIMAVTQ